MLTSGLKLYCPLECQFYHLCHLDDYDFLNEKVSKELKVQYLSEYTEKDLPNVMEAKPFCPHNLFVASIPISQKNNVNNNINNKMYNGFFIIDPLSPYSIVSVDLLNKLGFEYEKEIEIFGLKSQGGKDWYGHEYQLKFINILGLAEISKCFQEIEINYFNNPPSLKLIKNNQTSNMY